MNSIEAMIYCLGFINEEIEDGEYRSQTVYDRDNNPHWIAWEVSMREYAVPQLQSEHGFPFCKIQEPFSTGEKQ